MEEYIFSYEKPPSEMEIKPPNLQNLVKRACADFNLSLEFVMCSAFAGDIYKSASDNFRTPLTLHDINLVRQLKKWMDEGCSFRLSSDGKTFKVVKRK